MRKRTRCPASSPGASPSPSARTAPSPSLRRRQGHRLGLKMHRACRDVLEHAAPHRQRLPGGVLPGLRSCTAWYSPALAHSAGKRALRWGTLCVIARAWTRQVCLSQRTSCGSRGSRHAQIKGMTEKDLARTWSQYVKELAVLLVAVEGRDPPAEVLERIQALVQRELLFLYIRRAPLFHSLCAPSHVCMRVLPGLQAESCRLQHQAGAGLLPAQVVLPWIPGFPWLSLHNIRCSVC